MGAGSGTGSDAGSISMTRLGRPISNALSSGGGRLFPASGHGSSGAYPAGPFRAWAFRRTYAGASR